MAKKIESWRFYHAAMKILGRDYLTRLYARSARLVFYWAADPRFVDVSHRNPLDRLRDMLRELDLYGGNDIARAAIDFLAEPLGGRFTEDPREKTDKGTVDGEVADIVCALGRLTDQVRDARVEKDMGAQERIRIKELARAVQREVDQLLDAAGIDE